MGQPNGFEYHWGLVPRRITLPLLMLHHLPLVANLSNGAQSSKVMEDSLVFGPHFISKKSKMRLHSLLDGAKIAILMKTGHSGGHDDPYPYWVEFSPPQPHRNTYSYADLKAQTILDDRIDDFLANQFGDCDYLRVGHRIYFRCEKMRLIFLMGWI